MPSKKELEKIKEKIDVIKDSIIKPEIKKGIVLGLDLSKSCPGISVLDLNCNKVLFIDSYPSNEKNNLLRYKEIQFWLENIIDTFMPEAIMIEKEMITRMASSSNIILLKLHGFVDYVIQKRGIDLYEILPTSSRAFLKIKPNKKEQAFKWVQENFKELGLTDFKTENDIADSIIIALNYYNYKKRTKI